MWLHQIVHHDTKLFWCRLCIYRPLSKLLDSEAYMDEAKEILAIDGWFLLFNHVSLDMNRTLKVVFLLEFNLVPRDSLLAFFQNGGARARIATTQSGPKIYTTTSSLRICWAVSTNQSAPEIYQLIGIQQISRNHAINRHENY